MSAATAEHAGYAYSRQLALDDRRATGTVYTPPHVASFVLDLAGYTSDQPIEQIRLLEPACGCGAFLELAMDRLAARLVTQGVELTTEQGANTFIRLASENLHGVDIDERACGLAASLLQQRADQLATAATEEFRPSIRHEDFLAGPGVGLFNSEPRYHLIVGNPPYVSTQRLDGQAKERLRRRYRTAHGRIDLYAVFFERGLELLQEQGRLAFITPDKYLVSGSGTRLRQLLGEQASVQTIARFTSHRVFAQAATVPCVTVLQRGRVDTPPQRLDCTSSSDSVQVQSRHSVTVPERGEPWYLIPRHVHALADQIQGSWPRLSAFSERISAGIATGRDGVYVISSDVARDLEDELIRPAVRGQEIGKGTLLPTPSRIIVPYRRGELVDIHDYPRIEAYLTEHREELAKRHCVRVWGKAWYDLHDPWPPVLERSGRLLLPDLANSNRFAFDTSGRIPLHSAYYIVPRDIDGAYLAAVLNSDLMEFMIRLRAPVVKDGFSRYRKQFLVDLPIPVPVPQEARALARMLEDGDFDELNQRVARLFGLGRSQRVMVAAAVARIRRGDTPWGSRDGT